MFFNLHAQTFLAVDARFEYYSFFQKQLDVPYQWAHVHQLKAKPAIPYRREVS